LAQAIWLQSSVVAVAGARSNHTKLEEMAVFNINSAVVKEFQTKTFHEIADADVTALEGIGPMAKEIFEDGAKSKNTVHTVRDLANWHYYRLACAFVGLRDTEQQGKREEHCEQSLRGALNKAWAGKSLQEICAAPVSAFFGLGSVADERFAKAPLHITSIEKLAECKFCRWASAISTIAELAEEDTALLRVTKALEEAEAEKTAAKEAQAKAEQVAEAAKSAMSEALQRAQEAEKAKAGAEKAAETEHEKEEAAHKAEEAAKVKASIVEAALDDAMKKLQQAEAAKAQAEKMHKEEQQKRREEQRKVALEAQERKGKELEARFRKLFHEIDYNNDGNVTHAELKRYVASVDPAARLKLGIGRWQDFLAEADKDGDGKVSAEEFVAHFTRTNLDPVKCYGALFDAIDCHSMGYITKGEFREYQWYKNPNLFRLLGVSNWEDFVRTVDYTGDGVIHRDEFVSHFASMQSLPQVLSFGDESGVEPAAKRARRNGA